MKRKSLLRIIWRADMGAASVGRAAGKAKKHPRSRELAPVAVRQAPARLPGSMDMAYACRVRIALVIQHADPLRGGAERYTLDIARALSHRGHDVTILASSFNNVPWETRQLKIEGRGLAKLGAYQRFLHNLEQHLVGTSYDVVHSMLPVRWCDVYHPHAGIAAEAIETGHLKYQPGWRRTLARLGNRLNLKRRKTAQVERALLMRRNPPLVLCLSDYVRQTLRKHYPLKDEDMPTLFNAVDLRHFDPSVKSDARERLRRELEIGPEKVIALIVAQDFHRKGLRETIMALSRAQEPKLTLVVVGRGATGPYRRVAISMGVELQVIFAGQTDDTASWYRAADFLVLPTKHDPCSLVVLEALAMGLPVISTRLNGATEIMTNGVDGFILDDPTNLPALASAMKQLTDPRRRSVMREACLGQRARLSFDNHLGELLKLYQAAVARRLRGGPTT
jgi:UDP-glucose:(heptosyl)LPS alpha-1,3-glucosyltransferase